MLLSNEALFGIEVDLICSRPVDSTDSSLGSSETADDTRGIIPAEHNLSGKLKKRYQIINTINHIIPMDFFSSKHT